MHYHLRSYYSSLIVLFFSCCSPFPHYIWTACLLRDATEDLQKCFSKVALYVSWWVIPCLCLSEWTSQPPTLRECLLVFPIVIIHKEKISSPLFETCHAYTGFSFVHHKGYKSTNIPDILITLLTLTLTFFLQDDAKTEILQSLRFFAPYNFGYLHLCCEGISAIPTVLLSSSLETW